MSAAATLKRPPVMSDHYLGSLDAPVVIVKYIDFQCPHSAEALAVLDQIMKANRDLCLVLRHFPLTAVHNNAGVAAMAAEAAGKQGMFWEMSRALFGSQKDLESEKIFQLARELGLNMRLFLNDLEDDGLFGKVQIDFTGGIESEISETPTLYINGVHFEGDIEVDEIQDEIDEILRQHRSQPRV